MSQKINQDVRFAEYGNDNNPTALLADVKPTRIIINELGGEEPPENTGEDLWWLIDSDTGKFWYKNLGEWILYYVFGSGGGGGGLQDAENVGSGLEVFKDKEGLNLIFRTLISQADAAHMPIEIIQLENEVKLTTYPSINQIEDFDSGDASIIKDVTTDETGYTTLVTKPLISGLGIQINEDNGRILITNSSPGTGALNDYGFFTVPGAFAGGFGPTINNLNILTYDLNTIFSRPSSHWSVEDSPPTSFLVYNGPSAVYEMTRYIDMTVNSSLNNQIQQLDHVLTNIDNLAEIVPHSGMRITFGPYVANEPIESNATASFMFQPVSGRRYILAFFNRQTNGARQSCTFNAVTITLKQVQ